MKQLEVTILGQSYLLGCPDGGEMALLEAVGTVDREMSAIRDAGKVKARERIAVLAALNLAYALAQAADSAAASMARPASNAPVDGASSGIADVDLDALIARIDQVLAADGQLI